MSDELKDLRRKIDVIDDKIMQLLAERFTITRKVGEYKYKNGLNPVDHGREERQFEKIVNLSKKYAINPAVSQNILRIIIDEVVRNHKELRK